MSISTTVATMQRSAWLGEPRTPTNPTEQCQAPSRLADLITTNRPAARQRTRDDRLSRTTTIQEANWLDPEALQRQCELEQLDVTQLASAVPTTPADHTRRSSSQSTALQVCTHMMEAFSTNLATESWRDSHDPPAAVIRWFWQRCGI